MATEGLDTVEKAALLISIEEFMTQKGRRQVKTILRRAKEKLSEESGEADRVL